MVPGEGGGYSYTWVSYGGFAVLTPVLGILIRLGPYFIP